LNLKEASCKFGNDAGQIAELASELTKLAEAIPQVEAPVPSGLESVFERVSDETEQAIIWFEAVVVALGFAVERLALEALPEPV